ncbi:MAG: VOC family protein [Chloroflexi bacterium]|nr:VOC family protein [Chloroflexota bacterium]
MRYKLDHVVLNVHDLDAGIVRARAEGFNAFFGGVHAAGTTHNALMCFADGSYAELLALTGQPPISGAGVDFAWLIDGRPEEIVAFALVARDIDAEAAALRVHGVPVGLVSSGQRQRSDGQLLQWRLAWIELALPIMLIQDVTARRLRVPDDPQVIKQPNGVAGISALVLPPALENSAHFTTLFGPPQPDSNGARRYTLDGSHLIVMPGVAKPSIHYAKTT